MFPLFATVNGIIFIIALLAGIKVWKSPSTLGSPAREYFSFAYLLAAIYFFLHSFTEIPISNPLTIQQINIVSKFFIFTSIGFLVAASLEIHKNEKRKSIIISSFIALSSGSILASILTFTPAKIKTLENTFFYWEPGGEQWTILFEGILIFIFLLIPLLIFFWKGSIVTNKDMKKQLKLISKGFSFLIVSILFNFVILPIEVSPVFSLLVASGSVIFAAIGIILTVKGFLYKGNL